MMARRLLSCLSGAALCVQAAALPLAARAQDRPKVEFRDGDRIALVGNEFFEREQDRGYIETQLTTRFPDKHVTFHNLGYSGDTVWADARNLCAGWATFGPPDQGFNRLKQLVAHVKPTLIFVAYGMNESFDGQPGLARFEQGMNRMLDMLAESGARLVLVSPIRHEDLGPPLPDPAAHNKNIRLYIDVEQKIAHQRGLAFIDLYEALGDGAHSTPPGAFTSDGIHLTPYGYWRVAITLEKALGYEPRGWHVELDAFKGTPSATGTKVNAFKMSGGLGAEFSLSFSASDEMSPLAPAPIGSPRAVLDGQVVLPGQQRLLRIRGLPVGAKYALAVDGQVRASASGERWAQGVQLRADPAQEQEQKLRQTVIAKNFDFFNYWRPQNDTYIFGYRQHEQGRNAVEIPRFEPLVEAREAEIVKLKMPIAHKYRLEPQQGEN